MLLHQIIHAVVDKWFREFERNEAALFNDLGRLEDMLGVVMRRAIDEEVLSLDEHLCDRCKSVVRSWRGVSEPDAAALLKLHDQIKGGSL